MRATKKALAAALALAMSCMRASESSAPSEASSDRFAKMEMANDQDGRRQAAERPSRSAVGALAAPAAPAMKKAARGGNLDSTIAVDFGDDSPRGGGLQLADNKGESVPPEVEEAGGAQSRSWFPETFLFQPLVETDVSGAAAVEVRVPDRLTNWRVLALAFTRQGAQAGGVATFQGTLPAYVDPVVPGFLMAGDEVRLPVQVVNTTGAELSRKLSLEAAGGALSFGGGVIRVPAHGTRVEYATLRATRPGLVVVRAALSGEDVVSRSVQVWPTGRYLEARRGGTLAAPREVTLTGARDLEKGSAKLRLLVYPGALALLRGELSTAGARGGAAEDAYALLLAGQAPSLLRALGETPDEEAVRRLFLTASQRAVRLGKAPPLWLASLLVEAAHARPDDPVLRRLGERMGEFVARAQRPDGTFAGGDGWTLQRLLVTTAECLHAVRSAGQGGRERQRALAATVRASGAFERNAGRVEDGYTAASLLASGGLSGALAERLRERVRNALRTDADGARSLPVEAGVLRPDGWPPSEIEATALAALALEGDEKSVAARADLGARLLASYSPSRGWGDGRANLVALRAVISLFREKLPDKIRIVLEMDGKPLREGELDARHVRDTLALDTPAPDAAGEHVYRVRAEPPVAGLGFSLTLQSWVPWKKEPASSGLELSITPARAGSASGAVQARAGAPVELLVEAAAPAGFPLRIRHALPAGAQADAASLDALVASGALSSWRAEEGALVLEVPARTPGQTFSARYRVIPTLAGKLRTGASSVSLEGQPEAAHSVPPALWQVL